MGLRIGMGPILVVLAGNSHSLEANMSYHAIQAEQGGASWAEREGRSRQIGGGDDAGSVGR
jgi:hypothetical protein